MNKELIKKEADEFANKEYEISDIDRDALHKGFYHGADWRINSVWHNADKKPKDGKYLTIIKVKGELIIEIAPWRNGKYQGTHHIGVYFGHATIVKYANIYDLLPSEQIE